MKNRKTKLGIAVIAVALVVSFVAYDIAWAYPDRPMAGFDREERRGDKLAPKSLFKDEQGSFNAYGKLIEGFVERKGPETTLKDVATSLDYLINRGALTDYNIAYMQSKGEVLIRFRSVGYVLRYFDPEKAMEKVESGIKGVTGQVLDNIILNGNLHKQLIKTDPSGRKANKQEKARLWVLWSALAFIGLYWTVDTAVRMLAFNAESFLAAFFLGDPYVIFARAFLTVSIIIFGFISQHYYNKYTKILSESQETKEKYEEAFKNAPVAFHRLDATGRIMEVNTRWLLEMGYINKADLYDAKRDIVEWAKAEVIGKSIFDFVVPEQREGARLRFTLRLLGMDTDKLPHKSGDREYLAKDGRRIKAETRDTILRDKKDGFPIGVETSFVDLTERRKAEDALKASEERFRNLFDRMSSGMVIYEAVDGGNDFVIKDFNPAAERIQKVKKEQLIGRRVSEVFPGVKEFGFMDMFKRVWQTGKSEEYHEMHYANERNEVSGWMDNRVYKLPSGEIVIVFDDVTARKEAELKLVEERDRLRTLIDNMPDLIYIKDRQGMFVVANNAVADFMGATTPDGLIGKTDEDFFPDEMATIYQADEKMIIASGKPLIGKEEPARNASGKTRWLLTTKVPLRSASGEIIGIVGIGRDITEIKGRDEELVNKNKMLEELNKQLEQLMLTDPLTGARSRRFLDENFKLAYSAFTRAGTPMSLIMFDIDHFKRINDDPELGHDVGDRVLAAVVEAVRNIEIDGHKVLNRETECIVRNSGGADEFFVCLPERNLNEATKVAEVILKTIRDLKIPGKGTEPLKITASLGVAQYVTKKLGPEEGSREIPEMLPDLIKRADVALYKAKQNGRDQVVVDPLVPAPAVTVTKAENASKADHSPKHGRGKKTGDGTIMQGDEAGEKAFERMVKGNLACQNIVDATYSYHVKSDIKQMLKRVGARSIEDMLGSDKEVRVVVTDAVVVSCGDFCFGFYSHAPPVKEKLIALLGQDKFDAMFPRPTLVLTTEALSNPDPSVRQEYILHEILCSACGHYQAIFNQQKIFPENYKDGKYVEFEGKKYIPEWVGKAEQEMHPFKGKLGASLRDTINRIMKDPVMREAMHDLQNTVFTAKNFAYRTVGKSADHLSDEDAQTLRDYFNVVAHIDYAAHRYLTESPDKAEVLNVLSANLADCVRLTNAIKAKFKDGKYTVDDKAVNGMLQNNIPIIIEESEKAIIPTMRSAVNWLGRSMDKIEDVDGFLRVLIRRLAANDAVALSKITFAPIELGPGVNQLQNIFTYRAILETNIREFVKNIAKYGSILSVTLEDLVEHGMGYGFSEDFISMGRSYLEKHPELRGERLDKILGSAEQKGVPPEFVQAASQYRRPIEVKISVYLTEEGEMRVTVKDNGKGISAARLAKLFTPGVTESTDNTVGTGFGLASIKESVESVGGVISVESEVNKGSAFSFTLPVNAPLDILRRPALPTSIIVALSGLRGSGRKVVCRKIAAKLGLRYINMGFIMRILTYKILEEQKKAAALGNAIDLKNEETVAGLIEKILFTDKSIDYSAEPLKVDGIDTVAPSPEDGSSLRDRIKLTIDKNDANFNFMTEMSQYAPIKKVVDRFIKTMADDIKASGKFNGVILRVDEPSQLKGVINVVFNAPSYIRASRSKQDISWIEKSDALPEKRDFATRHLNVDRVDTSYKGVQDVTKEVLAHILPKIPVSDGLIRGGERAFKRMVGEIIAGNFANIEGQIDLTIDMESIGKYMGSLEQLTASTEKVRVIVTDAIILSKDQFSFGFYSHALPVKEKLIRLLGAEEFARIFPKPTLVLSKEILANPTQALRQCYILHTILCQTLGHDQAILKERQIFPDQYGDNSISALAALLAEVIKSSLMVQAQSSNVTRIRADQKSANMKDISAVIAELITQAYSLSKSAPTLERAYALLMKTLLLIENLPSKPDKKLFLEMMGDMLSDEKSTSTAGIDSETLLPLINKYIETGDLDELQQGLRDLHANLVDMYRDMLSRDLFKQVSDLILVPNSTVGGFVRAFKRKNFPADTDLKRFMDLNVWVDEMFPELGGEERRISSMRELENFLTLVEKMLEDERVLFAAFREKNAKAIAENARVSGNVKVIIEELERMQKTVERLSMFVGPDISLEDLVDRMAPITTMFDIGLKIPQELHVVGMGPGSDSLITAHVGGSVKVRAQVYVPDFMPQNVEKRPGIENFAERFLRVQVYTSALKPARSIQPLEQWPTVNMHFVGIGGEQNHDYIFEGEIPLEHISEPGPDGRPFEFRFMVRAEIKKEGESGYGFVWLEQRNRSGTNPEGDGKIIVLPPERTPEESLDAIHAVALPQLQAAIATSGSKILVSKSLLSDEDMVALGTALNKDIVEIIDPTDMLHRATNTNAGTNPGTLACVMSRLDFETLKAKGLTQHNNRSTLLVLEEDLKDVRYLYTEGVIGMARAMMVKDMQKAIAYRDLLFGPSVNNEMLNKLLQGDQVVFFNELTDVFRFKPIIAIDTSHLPEYKVIMENYLRQA